MTPSERRRFLEFLLHTVHQVEITEPIPTCRDSKDDQVLALAVCSRANWIITEDNDLLDLNPYRGFISATDFLDIGVYFLLTRSPVKGTVSRSGDLVMALAIGIAGTKDDCPASVEGSESHNTKYPIPIRDSTRIHRRGAGGCGPPYWDGGGWQPIAKHCPSKCSTLQEEHWHRSRYADNLLTLMPLQVP